MLQLSEQVRGHVAFLTYGSPLHRLYAPWFPAYFNVATFAELDQRLADRWQNLYRNTDPIGGRIPPGPPTNVEIVPVDAIPRRRLRVPADPRALGLPGRTRLSEGRAATSTGNSATVRFPTVERDDLFKAPARGSAASTRYSMAVNSTASPPHR